MNVSASSGASAAWMLQRLFSESGETGATNTASGAERQKMPGGSAHECNASGVSAPQMAGSTMSAMVGMQMGSPPQPPAADEVASNLIDALDTNGDGEVSAEEIAAAFSQAGLETDGIEKALSSIDADGNGSLNADELTSAVERRLAAHRPPGPPPGAGDAASAILSAFDSDEDGGLSLTEIASGLGADKETGTLSALFASLDSDGDGVLNPDELTSAIQADMDKAQKAYAQSARMVEDYA